MIDVARREEIVRLHADPEHGSRFWRERLARLGITAERLVQDPLSVPPMGADDMRGRPVEDFVPAAVLAEQPYLITGETSGFSGKPVITAFLEEEFRAGFVTPFIEQARRVGFPLRVNWLWAGPSGPHIIGKAVRAILREVNGLDPFAVDFDPRWFRRQARDSLSARRYLEHLAEQIFDVLNEQRVEVIFTTPPVLALLGERMAPEARTAVRGVHYGGMAMTVEQYRGHRQAFPNSVHMSGYGNSLFGMFPETGFSEAGLAYATPSTRIDVQVVRREGDRFVPCTPGETGQILVSRYDRSTLVINMLQEDIATRTTDGILHPHREEKHLAGKLLY
jgi:hypothetical protein